MHTGEYKKSLDDTIDWAIIDQLHAATARFSSACTEVKKIYITVLAAIIPLIIHLSGQNQGKPQLSYPVFISVFIATAIFWFLDSYCYYYQEYLRSLIDQKFEKIKTRNRALENPVDVYVAEGGWITEKEMKKDLTLDDKRTAKSRLWRSINNSSMFIYWAAILINSTLFVLFYLEKI